MLNTNVNSPGMSPGSTSPTGTNLTQSNVMSGDAGPSVGLVGFFRSLSFGSLKQAMPYLERFTATQRERESETRQS